MPEIRLSFDNFDLPTNWYDDDPVMYVENRYDSESDCDLDDVYVKV